MICDRFVHIGMGSTGEGIIRVLLHGSVLGKLLGIEYINTDAHMTLEFARTLTDSPSFTFIRNPFDWYISWYLVEMKYHRWRGGFEDWFYHRQPPIRLWEYWKYMTNDDCDYVGRFECYEDDLIAIWGTLIPDLATEEDIHEAFQKFCYLYPSRPWIEGIEQWLRRELYTAAIIEDVYKVDAPLFERFGYSFEEHYFFSGGLPPARHKGIKGISWNETKKLSVCWAEWGPERRGPFVKQLPIIWWCPEIGIIYG